MTEREKITIIEGPPPAFELVNDPWLLGLAEGILPSQIAMCQLRTFNGAALVERCFRAWQDQQPISLEYNSEEGGTLEAPIVAARWAELEEGQLLLLWVRLDEGQIEIELDFDFDDSDEDFDDAFDGGDLTVGF